MRSVDLIPHDARRAGVGPSFGRLGGSHLIIALMVVALGLVTVYVLTNNTISSRKAQLAQVQQEVSQVQAAVARLQSYRQFEQLAQARAQTVEQIANGRFDWHRALSDLSKVVPARTSLQSLVATVSPNAASGGSGAAPGGSVRGDINAPAFQLKGCTGTQDEVAQLISRLRLMGGVSRVTLEDSAKPTTSPSGTSTGSASAACSGPTFDMVVFFQPAAAGVPSATGQPTGAASPGSVK